MSARLSVGSIRNPVNDRQASHVAAALTRGFRHWTDPRVFNMIAVAAFHRTRNPDLRVWRERVPGSRPPK